MEPFASKVRQVRVKREGLAVTLRIVGEVLFTVIGLEAWRKRGFKQLSELRDCIRKRGLEEFCDAISDVEEFMIKLGIQVLEDRGDLARWKPRPLGRGGDQSSLEFLGAGALRL